MKSNKIFGYAIIFSFTIVICFALSIYAQQETSQEPAPASEKSGTYNPDEVTGWRISDFQPYLKAMRDLQMVSTEYSELILKLAMDEYATGIDILEDMESEVLRLKEFNKNKKNLNEKWYWQEIDRKNQEKRQIERVKREAKMKSITNFVKAINHIDQVSSKDVIEKPEFINFKIRLFQVYVSTQYDLHNYLQCIPILERYLTINEETRKDVWAYKYLANCYAFVEAMLVKNRHSSSDVIMSYKQKKNKCLLQAAEIQYGVDSVEYKHLNEVVGKDEIKSERLNDFQ